MRFTNTLPIRMAVVELDGLEVTTSDSAFRALEQCAERWRGEADQRGVTAPGAFPGVQAARGLFRQLKIDPTKHRPSSEALLNRSLKRKSLPKINTLVDVGNWWSLEYLLPLGLYDLDRVHGPVTLREGLNEERYDALNGRSLNLAGRYVLADDRGPFGTPITDSARSAVSTSTRRAGYFVYAPCDEPASLREDVERLADRTVEHCGGQVTSLEVFG